jgi:glucose dehydrogenase
MDLKKKAKKLADPVLAGIAILFGGWLLIQFIGPLVDLLGGAVLLGAGLYLAYRKRSTLEKYVEKAKKYIAKFREG